jgi:hypothetical protein
MCEYDVVSKAYAKSLKDDAVPEVVKEIVDAVAPY